MPPMETPGINISKIHKINPSKIKVPKPKVTTKNRSEIYDKIGHNNPLKKDNNKTIINATPNDGTVIPPKIETKTKKRTTSTNNNKTYFITLELKPIISTNTPPRTIK